MEDYPSIEIIKLNYPLMSGKKSIAMLDECRRMRKFFEETLNIKSLGTRNSKGRGFIYLIVNSAFTGWIKCGKTTDLNKRLGSYNTSDPLKRFEVLISKMVDDRNKCESNLIKNIELLSLCREGEWFKIDKDVAVDIFNKI